jgi:hypothetical protein
MTTQTASRPSRPSLVISKTLSSLSKSPKVTDIIRLDECFKGSSLLLEHERDPKTKSEEPSDVAVGRAYSKRMSYFNLLSEPDNSFMLRRLNTAMLGFKTMVSDDVSCM